MGSFITQNYVKHSCGCYGMLYYAIGCIATAQWIFECMNSTFQKVLLSNNYAMADLANDGTWNDKIDVYGLYGMPTHASRC